MNKFFLFYQRIAYADGLWNSIYTDMKTRLIILINVVVLMLSINVYSKDNSAVQDVKTIEGVFDGHEDYGYNFISAHSDGSEYTMTFQKIDESLLGQFDLNSEMNMGKRFKVSYKVTIKKTKDEYGFEDEEEILTIINLEEF